MVGVVIALSAAITLLTRQVAGALSDRRGPKLAGAATAGSDRGHLRLGRIRSS